MELNAAARLRAYTFPSEANMEENLYDLLDNLGINYDRLTTVNFGSIKAPAAMAHLGLEALKAKVMHSLEKAKDESFTVAVSEEGQVIHCVSGKFEEEFPKQGRLTGLLAVLMSPKDSNRTLVCVAPWRDFLKYKRLG